jgi:hypothetical protein
MHTYIFTLVFTCIYTCILMGGLTGVVKIPSTIMFDPSDWQQTNTNGWVQACGIYINTCILEYMHACMKYIHA